MFVVTLGELNGSFYVVDTEAGKLSIPAEKVKEAGCKTGDEVEISFGPDDEISQVRKRRHGIEGSMDRTRK